MNPDFGLERAGQLHELMLQIASQLANFLAGRDDSIKQDKDFRAKVELDGVALTMIPADTTSQSETDQTAQRN